eukprot:TRINITY_DN1972_c1_g3_i1.p3 TRINITY_DN1972_c1_g3~~TRINITY_DN1972_c1_g3_i1.p3  ORF type:complete len:274 (+),score=90.45 TRINITY_DN1972_c1_g3_i1:99-824(+)
MYGPPRTYGARPGSRHPAPRMQQPMPGMQMQMRYAPQFQGQYGPPHGAPRGYYHARPRPSGPQLPFARELLDRVPTENVGDSLPFLSEIRVAAQDFVHPLPSAALPFVDELRSAKPAVPAGQPGGGGIDRFGTTRKLSQAVGHGGVVYLSGAVPGDRSGDVAAQATDVLGKIAFRLGEAGSSPAQLLQATVFLASAKDTKEFVKVWEEWLPEGCAPAFTCVEAKLGNPQWKVQISAIAAKN